MFWTKERDEDLRRLFGERKSDKELVDALGRSLCAIKTRRQRLGLKRADQPVQLVGIKGAVGPRHLKRYQRWTPEEDMTLKELYSACHKKGKSWVKRIACKLKRPPMAVVTRLQRAGLLGKQKLGALKRKVFPPIQHTPPQFGEHYGPTDVMPQVSSKEQPKIVIRCSLDKLKHTIHHLKGLEEYTTVTVV